MILETEVKVDSSPVAKLSETPREAPLEYQEPKGHIYKSKQGHCTGLSGLCVLSAVVSPLCSCAFAAMAPSLVFYTVAI